MVDFNELEYEYNIINLLKDRLKGVEIVSAYPSEGKKYPLAVTSIEEIPIEYTSNATEIKSEITLSIEIWHNTKTKSILLRKDIEKILVEYGLTRDVVNATVVDNQNNKWYVQQFFKISFNRLNGKFERSI